MTRPTEFEIVYYPITFSMLYKDINVLIGLVTALQILNLNFRINSIITYYSN